MKKYLLGILLISIFVQGSQGTNSPKVNLTEPNQSSTITEKQAIRPNIVLIYIDDLGYGDIGTYGSKDIPTPNIDRLATEGVRFTSSHITNPPCSPSRCTLMMGQYGQRFGKYGMARGLAMPEDRPSLAKFLTKNGYVTGQIGKWDIGSKQQGPLKLGFMEVAKNPPRKQYTEAELASASKELQNHMKKKKGMSKYFCINEDGETQWLTDYDGESIVNFVDRNKNEPFFLYWSPEAVHSFSTEVPKRLMDRTKVEGNIKRQKLGGAIISVDDQIGKLMSALEKNGIRENTLVIFSSDNGANTSDGGSSAPYAGGKGPGTQKEGWVRVPTIFSMPGTLPEGTQYDGLISNFDFYSTIATLAGQPIPEHCDGVDLFPYLKSEQNEDPHEYLFWLNNQPDDAPRRHLIAVRWQEWRLYKKYEKDTWQLFNLKEDPKEENNIAEKHPDIVRKMAGEHEAWSKNLAPHGEISKVRGKEPVIPNGHGWAYASEK